MASAGFFLLTPAATLYLVGAIIGATLVALLVLTGPRKLSQWLLVVLLALGAAGAFAQALMDTLTANGAQETSLFHALAGTALDFSFPTPYIAIAWACLFYAERRRSRLASSIGYAVLATGVFLESIVLFDKRALYEFLCLRGCGYAEADFLTGLLVDNIPYYVAVATIAGVLGALYIAAEPGARKASGLALVAFSAGPLTAMLADPLTALFSLPVDPYYGIMALVGFLIAGVFWCVLFVGRRRGLPVGGPAAMGAGLVAFGAVGSILAYGNAANLISESALGLLWGDFGRVLFRPALLLYAVANYPVLGFDLRGHERGLSRALLVLVGAVFLPAEEFVQQVSPLGPDMAVPVGIAGGIVASVATYTVIRDWYSHRTDTDRTLRVEEDRQIGQRRIALYEGALASALGPDLSIPAAKEAEVRRLRLGLSITDTEHATALAAARKALEDAGPDHGGPLPVGSLVRERYRIDALLGEGGGGRTYRAWDTTLERTVAVKEILAGTDPRLRESALREARLMARVHHPNVISLHEIAEAAGRTFLVMEYASGGSLATRLRSGPLPPADAQRILVDVLEGLSALHAEGLLHRDIKPSNVLIDAQGHAKVGDLGAARSPMAADVTLGAARAPGTPIYMAPEQVLGAKTDVRTDLYAAGLLLHEMLTGESYVRAAARQGTLVEEMIVSRPPPIPLPSAPAWANAFLAATLRKEAGERCASAAAARALALDSATALVASASLPRAARETAL
ncbi:MAG: serine/threonine-protein kinase [Thermoplasmatota archaeon]